MAAGISARVELLGRIRRAIAALVTALVCTLQYRQCTDRLLACLLDRAFVASGWSFCHDGLRTDASQLKKRDLNVMLLPGRWAYALLLV